MQRINPYAVAVLSIFVAAVLTQVLYPLMSSVSFALFYAAVAIATWAGGAKPGLVANVLSVLSISYFFLQPIHSFAITAPGNFLRLALSVFVSSLVSFLISKLRNSQYKIQQLSDRRLQAEEQLRLAMQAADMGMWNWNLATGEIVWTPEHERLLGLAPGTFDGRYETFDARLHPDDRAGLTQAVQTAIQEHSTYKHEYRIIWTDGSVHWVEGRGQAFYDEVGQPVRMTGTLMSIDERKRLEIALKQSEQQFRAIFEAEPECIKVVTADGILHNMNPAGLAMIEADSLEQVLGQCVCPLVEPAHQQAFLEFTQQVAQGKTATLKFEIIALKGTRRWLESHAVPLQIPNEANPLVLAVTRDITEQKRAEEIIRNSEERYRSLVTATFQIVWTTDADGNTTSVSPAWSELTGQAWNNLQQWGWIDYLHPDDRDRAVELWKQAVAAQITCNFEYRLRAKEGNYRDFKVRGVPVKNLDGSIREWVGTFTDITERKQAEIVLLQSKLELEQRVAERTAELQKTNNLLNNFFNAASSAAIGLCIHDRESRFVQINEVLAAINGHSVEAHLGKSVAELLPELAPIVNPLLQQVLTTGQPILNLEIAAQVPSQPGVTPYWLASYFPVLGSDSSAQTVGVGVIIVEITARKLAEMALQKSEQKFRAIFEQTFQFIALLTTQGTLLEINQSPLDFAQVEREVVIGRPLWEFPSWSASVENQKIAKAAIAQAASGEFYRSEVTVPRGNSHYATFDFSVKPVLDEAGQVELLIAEGRDISDRKRAEAILVEADRRWRFLLDNVQLIVVGLDQDGNVEYVNPFFLQLTGYTQEEVLGKSWFNHFLPPSQKPAVKIGFQQVLEKKFHPHYHNSIVTKLGEERMIAWSNTLVRNAEGQPIGTISIGEDITERHNLEQMKAEFLSIVSHELRTPLTSISGALELLSTGLIQPDSERGQETISIAATEADRLTRLVNDILDLERLESGKMRLERQHWDLAQLMTRAVDFMQLAANHSAVTLSVEPLSVGLDVDGDRILQVLTNLLSNALKFSPNDSTIWLTAKVYTEEQAEHRRAEKPSAPMSPHVLISVRDQGRGIPASKLESIFERFQQVDASDSRKKGGTGLGLAICRSIVQQHGGNIWAESVLDQGSSFHFTLPLIAQDREPHAKTDSAD
ncbi:PAS domain S-box protein [Phormidium tenue FACHB-886]|nr:PAS domain S-box protein [Phormidium tenue FACHB-886]